MEDLRELRALKQDSFGRIALMRDAGGTLFVRRDLRHVPRWLRLPAWWLASVGHPRSPWMRLLMREDLRHLLKHKRSYCPQALTLVERRLLARKSWLRQAWFASGKRVYRFVTRDVLHWRDNEGRGPRP